jgi:hypothetical protein
MMGDLKTDDEQALSRMDHRRNPTSRKKSGYRSEKAIQMVQEKRELPDFGMDLRSMIR